MRLILAILLAAAPVWCERRDLYAETVSIPRSQWRAIRVNLAERPATLSCRYVIEEGESKIRALVLTAADTERFRRGESFRMLAATEARREGVLDFRISRPGDYMLLIDNRTSGGGAVKLNLRAWLDFRSGDQFSPQELPSQTRWKVAGFGLVWLLVAGVWPGWKIWIVWRRRRDALRGFYPDRL